MIGERLSEIRKDHGDTQADLANLLNVSLSTIRSWEQEKSSPSHELLISICTLYQISSDYLLGLSDIDSSYQNHQRSERLTDEDRILLRDYEEFLIWRRRERVKKQK
jgi:transcriptional regulator with XRE-family HTH domain